MLCRTLHGAGYCVRAALRRDVPRPDGAEELAITGDIGAATDWRSALRGVDTVVHLAARTHVIRDVKESYPLYVAANVDGTRQLVETSVECGVRRLIFVSSTKVYGDGSGTHAYTAADEPQPADSYGRSKWLAEQALLQIARRTGLEAVIVRPPLVYGPGVRANFLRLMTWINRQWPLPFGAVDNRRSLVNVWNLCDLLSRLVNHAAAPGQVWMVADAEDLSTPDLIRRLGGAMHRRVRLLPVPTQLLRRVAVLAGRQPEYARLCCSFVVDTTATRRQLSWEPPMPVGEALQRTSDWFFTEDVVRAT
jgi:nucleoside-diphosphate-sugar epimerase